MRVDLTMAAGRRRVLVRGALALGVALTALVVVEAVTPLGSRLGDAPSNAANASVGLLCALICLCRGRRPGDDNTGWMLIGAGIAAWALGNAYFTFTDGGPTAPSLADGLWLSFYVLVLSGLLVLGRRRMVHLGTALWLDGLIAGLACAAVCAAFVLDTVIGLGGASLLQTLAPPTLTGANGVQSQVSVVRSG